MRQIGVIYKITNLKNGKIYIGQTKKSCLRRWNEHVNASRFFSTSRLHKAIAKYGRDSFSQETLFVSFCRKQLDEAEKTLIADFQCLDPQKGYNTIVGGRGCHRLFFPAEEIDRRKKAMPSNKKAVICLQTGLVFDSINEASECLNIGARSIGKAANGKRKFAGGRKFAFLNNGDLTPPRVKKTKNPRLGQKQSVQTVNKRSKSLLANQALKTPEYKNWRRLIHKYAKIKANKNYAFLAEKQGVSASFLTLRDFAKFVNCSQPSVKSALMGRSKACNGWKLTYLNPQKRQQAVNWEAEYRKNIPFKKRPIICLQTGQEFESAYQAASILDIGRSAIANNLIGDSQFCRLPSGEKVSFDYKIAEVPLGH